MKKFIASFSLLFIFSCNSPVKKDQPLVVSPTVTKQDTVYEAPTADVTTNKEVTREQHAEMEFTDYNDDGDYTTLNAKKGSTTYQFINDSNTDRSLNRGDGIAVTWKNGTIYMAGDGDAPVDANILVSVNKTADGPVSKFRKTYKKQIKYTFYESEYSKSYLDNIYLIAEYYIATTKNPLLVTEIKQEREISYSIEEQEKNGRSYIMIGIATQNGTIRNTVQWLYIDIERQTLYEYDLPNDKLVEYP